jgi:hypothetical protein
MGSQRQRCVPSYRTALGIDDDDADGGSDAGDAERDDPGTVPPGRRGCGSLESIGR